MDSASVHVPVLLDEILRWISPRPGLLVVDGTMGGGGHTRELARRLAPSGRVVALDRDPAAVEAARAWIGDLPITPVHSSYDDLPEVLAELGIPSVDAILLDLGLSSDQLADDERGFSFQAAGPLDLRFDPTVGEPAWRWLERLSAERLADVIYEYGEERASRRIARAIVERRKTDPIRTAAQLAELVRRNVRHGPRDRIDPATRTFQALRIAVNGELEILARALERLPDCLAPGGRLAVISFHSLEDRLVKQAFRGDDRLESLTRKPEWPTDAETARNPRSRSARLRVAERKTSSGPKHAGPLAPPRHPENAP